MKFPVNGWQRTCCAECLYFGGQAEDPAMTVCKYPRMKAGDDPAEAWMKQPTAEEAETSDVAAKMKAPCYCFISMDHARDHFRLLMQATTNN